MIKYILAGLLSLALTGCMTSGGANDDFGNESGDNSSAAAGKPTANSFSVNSAGEEAPAPPAAKTSAALDTGLVEAIKSGNNESIYRASIQALSQNPNDVRALNALGMYHYQKAHYSAALLMFNKALKVSPNISDLHNNIGLVHLAQNEEREAMQSFKKAMELNSRDGTAAANIGAIYIEQKDYTKALVAMEIAYRKNSRDANILNNYGIALTANGKYREAHDIYKKGLSANPNSKDLMLNHAILLIDHLKANEEGLDLLNKVKFLGVSNEARNRINLLENKAKAGLK
jgi:Tfp pilus assembly protein PilF